MHVFPAAGRKPCAVQTTLATKIFRNIGDCALNQNMHSEIPGTRFGVNQPQRKYDQHQSSPLNLAGQETNYNDRRRK